MIIFLSILGYLLVGLLIDLLDLYIIKKSQRIVGAVDWPLGRLDPVMIITWPLVLIVSFPDILEWFLDRRNARRD